MTSKSTALHSGAHYLNIVSATAAYSPVFINSLILCDASGGAFSVTLPPATYHTGMHLAIKKTDSSANAVTIDGDGSETIDGSTTQDLALQHEVMHIACDGTEWWIL